MDFSEDMVRKQISPDSQNLSRFSFNEQKTMEYMMNRDPMQEFFALTCQSIKLNSPHINTIATIDTNQLYQKANKLGVPFFQWSTWIESYLNKEFMRVVLQKSKRQGQDSKPSSKTFIKAEQMTKQKMIEQAKFFN